MKQTLPQYFRNKSKLTAILQAKYKFQVCISKRLKEDGCSRISQFATVLAFLLFILPLGAKAQLNESFSDGDFLQNPTWTGDVSSFKVNAQNQLQSSGPAVTGSSLYLATPSRAAVGVNWEFWANLKLATSSSNYADVYLIADAANLTENNTSGYFVRIGGTPDEVSLFRKDAGKSAVTIINGKDKTIGSSNNIVRVRVTRSINYEWELQIDLTGTGQNFISQGTATDNTYQQSSFFGVLVKYTSANSQAFYFDDFTITDAQPPVLEELQTVNTQELLLKFNEPLQPEQAQNIANYTLNSSIKPAIAELTMAEKAVRLVFAQNLSTGSNIISINGLQDLYGNTIAATNKNFSFIPPAVLPNYNELLITEIMADETPAVGLPAQEYIELHNPTNKVLTLQGIRYSDATSTTTLPSAQLLPGEYAVVVPNAQVANFNQFGKVIGISNFPSLNNAGELLQLRKPNGQLIYAVNYADTWYKDHNKRDGGWSLEMIDVTNPCGGLENWSSSTHPSGGTPAQLNAVAASNPDNIAPVLTSVTAIAPDRLLLLFSEKLDSTQAVTSASYELNPNISISNVQVQGPLFTQVILQLASPLQEHQLYTLTARSIADCAGNLSSQPLQTRFALPTAPAPGDVVINEVLFNPRSNGTDFVELVNRSNKYINLQNWQLGNVSGDSIANLRTLSTTNYILSPGQYVVLTSNPENIKTNYPAAPDQAFLRMSSLPAYPDAAGTVVLLQPDSRVADRFSYTEEMHFALLDDVNGISLERVRLEGPTIAANFHSAASAVSATPGYKNSQSQESMAVQQVFKVEPVVFSPNDDGYQDFTTINYNTEQTGLVANITIFDAQGREVRKLVRNQLLASDGFFRWDGLTEDGAKAAIGYYVFYIELFDLNGQKNEFKEKVVVAEWL